MEYLGKVTKKKLRQDLIEILFPAPLYRSLYSQCPGQDVLRRVKRMCVPPAVKSFFFKLHSETLPVKPWLRDRGIFVPWSVDCLLCKTPESIDHVFIYCSDAVFVLGHPTKNPEKRFFVVPGDDSILADRRE